MPTKAEEVVDAFFSAMEKLEHDKVEKLFADDATIWHSFDDLTVGKNDIVTNVRNMAQFATLSFKVYDRLATDSTVAQRFDTIVHVPGQPDKVIPTAIFITVANGQMVDVHEYMESTRI
jgi:ketosteroid isomerase-like protein